jgi:hypothetical protein
MQIWKQEQKINIYLTFLDSLYCFKNIELVLLWLHSIWYNLTNEVAVLANKAGSIFLWKYLESFSEHETISFLTS